MDALCKFNTANSASSYSCPLDGGNSESPLFQWGIRPGGTCNSGFTGLGQNSGYGSGGHYVSVEVTRLLL